MRADRFAVLIQAIDRAVIKGGTELGASYSKEQGKCSDI